MQTDAYYLFKEASTSCKQAHTKLGMLYVRLYMLVNVHVYMYVRAGYIFNVHCILLYYYMYIFLNER